MNKHTVEINVPEGYEVAESKPRAPKKGEMFMDLDSKMAHECDHDFNHTNYVILRKKKPAYFSQVNQVNTEEGWKMKTMVEVKALEDAMKIIENMNMNPELDMFECNAYGPLKELLK